MFAMLNLQFPAVYSELLLCEHVEAVVWQIVGRLFPYTDILVKKKDSISQ